MNAVADIFRLPSYEPSWLNWLRHEMAPFPGRKEMMVRMVVSVLLVMVISMALRVPQAPYSAFFVFFVTKENRVLTTVTGTIMILGRRLRRS